MAFNLIDEAQKLLSNDLIRSSAAGLGENEDSIKKAFSGAIPSIIAGFLHKSGESKESTLKTDLLNMAKSANSGNLLNNVMDLLSGSSGNSGLSATITGWLRSIFGSKLEGVISSIAGFAGIKNSSAGSILSMAAPMALSPIGKYATDNGLGIAGLDFLLSSQKSTLLKAVPSGFNLSSILGLSSLQELGNNISDKISGAKEYVEKQAKATGSRWLWPLLLVLALVALAWYLSQKGCNSSGGSTNSNDTTKTVVTPVANNEVIRIEGKLDSITNEFVYDLGDTISLSLPNNQGELRVGKWSTEARLFEFLVNDEKAIDTAKGNWFDFTNVRFKTGGSVLTDDSYTQLKNLVTIIKAFPKAEFKIGGYTDSTGIESNNVILSQKRADAVANEIVKLGISNTQITGAVGYGSKFPIGDNSTPEGRAINRRVSVNVKAK